MYNIFPYISRNTKKEIRYKVHSCPNCLRKYKWRDSLIRHLRVECQKSAKFFCTGCKKTFKHKHNFIKHRKNCRFSHSDLATYPMTGIDVHSVQGDTNGSTLCSDISELNARKPGSSPASIAIECLNINIILKST
nr:unnamed protein product [Callosobruchus analis]